MAARASFTQLPGKAFAIALALTQVGCMHVAMFLMAPSVPRIDYYTVTGFTPLSESLADASVATMPEEAPNSLPFGRGMKGELNSLQVEKDGVLVRCRHAVGSYGDLVVQVDVDNTGDSPVEVAAAEAVLERIEHRRQLAYTPQKMVVWPEGVPPEPPAEGSQRELPPPSTVLVQPHGRASVRLVTELSRDRLRPVRVRLPVRSVSAGTVYGYRFDLEHSFTVKINVY